MSVNHCPNCNTVLAPESAACVKCGRKRDQKDAPETPGDREAIHAQTLARYRQHRDTIRAVKILAGCCPTCDLDGNREFSLDAVPALPHPYCTNPTGCHCCYVAVMQGAESTVELPAGGPIPSPVFAAMSDADSVRGPYQSFLQRPMTPLGAIIGACAVVLFLGFTVLKNASGPAANRSQNTVAPLQTLPSRSTAAPRKAEPKQVVSQPREEDRSLDRQIQATAARDLAQSEANARANANAMQANAMAAQQQAYLQSMFQQMQSRPAGIRSDRSAAMATISTARSAQ